MNGTDIDKEKLPPGNKCAYLGCGKTCRQDSNIHQYRFPKDEVRCQRWVINSGYIPGKMDFVQYTYSGKIWRPCPTAGEGDCFFHSAFGTKNWDDGLFRDKYAKFRRMYWSAFLTYHSFGDPTGALLDVLNRCFIANGKSTEDIDNFTYSTYTNDVSSSGYWVLVEEIPMLAALENVRIVLFRNDCAEPMIFEPNWELLGDFPFRSINEVREVVICLVDDHFSQLNPFEEPIATSLVDKSNTVAEATTRPKPKKAPRFNHKKSYPKLGSAGIKGSLYQINLLTMVLLNGIRKVENWCLSTEDKRAAQLDDLIFEYLPSESTILLQAKHKEDEKEEVTYKDMISVSKEAKFGLPKYFSSYQNVRSKFKIQNVVICTNLQLDKYTKSILKEERVDPDSVLHVEGAENICYGFSGCSLPELKPNIEKYYAKNVENKETVISDEDISDFLACLKFFPNFLDDKNVNKIIEQTISLVDLSKNLNVKVVQEIIHKKMTDWFKEKKGRYLTEVEANAFFCDIRSNKYCDNLTKRYDITLKTNNLPLILQAQQTNGEKCQQNENEDDPKRISHIIPDKEYMLNVVKIYQALPTHQKDKTLFVNPEEPIEVQRKIIDAFEVPHYTILVMVCPNMIEDTVAEETCDSVTDILGNHKYKRVILIAEKRNNLAVKLKQANSNYYEVITDSITFANLEESTQEEFKRKQLINFQGKTTSLGKLFPSPVNAALNQVVNSTVLAKLARDEQIEVGLELHRRDNYYIERSFNRNGRNIPEEDMSRPGEVSKEKVTLISDSAGMGKSTVLTSLAIAIKEYNPHLWVVRVDLNSYTKFLKASARKHAKSISLAELLDSLETSKLNSEFERKLFANPDRVVLMLDGVDEVCPTYTDLVINLLIDSLAQPNLAKILVTTRPHLCEGLEQVLRVRSFTLEPFSEDNQTDFLQKYWTEKLKLQDYARKRKCASYAKALIKQMSQWIDEKAGNTFAGIPLQTRMLAEVFQEGNQMGDWQGCNEFLTSDDVEPKLPKRINLIQLYEMFIDKKRDIFINDKSNPSGSAPADEALNEKFQECHEFHRSFALEIIFYAEEWQLFSCYKDLNCTASFAENYLLRAGIIQLQGAELHFIHRTFAEYFAAECILLELKCEHGNEKFQEFFKEEILMRDEYYVVRAFFDSFLQKELHALPDRTLKAYYSMDYLSILDNGNTYFHLFATEGCAGMLSFFIKCIDFETTGDRELDEEQFIYVNVTDSNRVTPLHEAAYRGHLSVVKILVERGADVDMEDAVGATALQAAILGGHLEVVQYLVEKAGANVNKKNTYDESVLYAAARVGHLNLVKFLYGLGVDVTGEFSTALHAAAYNNQLEVVVYLVDEAEVDVDVQDINGCTALYAACQEGHFDVVEFLVDRDCDVNIINRDQVTAFHAAIYRMRLDVVKYLLKKGADVTIEDEDGDTILDIMAMIQENQAG